MRRKIGKAKIVRIVIELDNNTEFQIDPQAKRVQTVRKQHNGLIWQHEECSMEKFLELMEAVVNGTEDVPL